ncbi:MAG: hypothetical protein NTY73_01985 [Candidatus Micrarchaeota archaeon]|nr:hypothetical protein [Candidatus Micrarchaeota archaeon]
MVRQKKERVNRDLSYQDIVDRLAEGDDVSFERIGDTIIMRRDEAPVRKVMEEPKIYEEPKESDDTEERLSLVKREIEKKKPRRVSREDYADLEEAFVRLERRLDSLDKELRGLRVELGYLRGVMLDRLREMASEEPAAERIEQLQVEEVAVGRENKQLQLVQEDIPEVTFDEERGGSRLGFITSTLSNIYNSFFLGADEKEKDSYKEFQKKLFLLVRTQPRSLDEIAYNTEENKANCLIWLTRMVDEGLLEEAVKDTGGKKVYRIVWEKVL